MLVPQPDDPVAQWDELQLHHLPLAVAGAVRPHLSHTRRPLPPRPRQLGAAEAELFRDFHARAAVGAVGSVHERRAGVPGVVGDRGDQVLHALPHDAPLRHLRARPAGRDHDLPALYRRRRLCARRRCGDGRVRHVDDVGAGLLPRHCRHLHDRVLLRGCRRPPQDLLWWPQPPQPRLVCRRRRHPAAAHLLRLLDRAAHGLLDHRPQPRRLVVAHPLRPRRARHLPPLVRLCRVHVRPHRLRLRGAQARHHGPRLRRPHALGLRRRQRRRPRSLCARLHRVRLLCLPPPFRGAARASAAGGGDGARHEGQVGGHQPAQRGGAQLRYVLCAAVTRRDGPRRRVAPPTQTDKAPVAADCVSPVV
mmetsp:Transcript_32443/g.85657  ORF Transcript_32443/g.85657 Transcript_32443/m.85657 type:complete len:363 (+) Transcript_32443:128-1216(+)